MDGPRVLVVEDDEDVRGLLSAHLRRLGCVVEQVATGAAGLAAARAVPPDLVLLDVLLPDLDGRDVARELAEDPATADRPVVLTSMLDAQDLAGLPVAGVLRKPFTRRDLARVLASVQGRVGRAAADHDPGSRS